MKPNRLPPSLASAGSRTNSDRPRQQVVDEEQLARVDPVGEPSAADRADDVEHADEGQVATGRGVADAVVVGRRDEVGLDEPGGRQAADEEAAAQAARTTPLVHAIAQGAERGADRVRVTTTAGRAHRRARAVAAEADVLGWLRRKTATTGMTAERASRR